MSFDSYINCEPTSGVTSRLVIDDGTSIAGTGQQHIEFRGIPDQVNGWGGYVEASAQGYKNARVRVQVVAPALLNPKPPEGDGGYVFVRLEKAPSFHPMIHVDGDRFVNADGSEWVCDLMDSYSLVDKVHKGENIAPLLDEMVEIKAGGARIYGAVNSFAQIHPISDPRVFDSVSQTMDLMAARGLVPNLTNGDLQIVAKGRAQQIQLFDTQCQIIRSKSYPVLYNPCNERSNNGLDVEAWAAVNRDGILWTWGHDATFDDWKPETRVPELYRGYGGRRDWKAMLSAEDMWYVQGGFDAGNQHWGPPKPCIMEEGIGFAEVDVPNRRSTSRTLAHALGLTTRAFGRGIIVHLEDGIYSRPLGPIQKDCARVCLAAVHGAQASWEG